MRFRVLGPFEAEARGQLIPLGRRRERCLLAVLLLNVGQVVQVARLVDLLWDDDPPASAHRHVQAHVARLRAALADAPDHAAARIITSGVGYLLQADPDIIDAHRFRSLVDAANGASTADHKAAVLREALGLWRGPALADIATERLRERVCGDLEELRLLALEERITADLDLGRRADLVAELYALSKAHPFRERVQALLMLALHRSGRDVEALRQFRTSRALLTEQHGVEPGALLRGLHEALLRGDPRLDSMPVAELTDLSRTSAGRAAHGVASGGVVTPRQPAIRVPRELPHDVAGFTGRDDQLQALDEAMQAGRHGAATAVTAPAIWVIAGTAGVGKTALAVHWAHRVSDRFPDGQLYLDLRGYAAASPVRPIEALTQLLRSLGVPGERIPHEEAPAAALYRSLLAERRVLVLLDNARRPEQVRPLLPGGPRCVVVITSRDQLGGLVAKEGARRMNLDVLPPDEAEALLARIVGPRRVHAERQAIARLARLCANLPLALRIAAANVTNNPHRSVADHVAELTDGDRLAALQVAGDEETAVRHAFDHSYRALSADAQRLFRRLGLVPGPDVTPDAAANLVQAPPEATRRLLDRLADAHLVDRHKPGRYTFHDLLRLYAGERADREESPADRAATTRRLFDWYLHMADAADRQLHRLSTRLPMRAADPALRLDDFTDNHSALDWLDRERHNLVAVCTAAARHGPRPVAWHGADALWRYLHRRRHLADWFTVAEAGLAAARSDGDRRAAAAAHRCLAIAYATGLGRYRQAVEHFNRSLALSRQVGWQEGRSAALNGLALTTHVSGRLDEAIQLYRRALQLARQQDLKVCIATALNNLSVACRDAGRLQQAIEYAGAALVLYREIGSVIGDTCTQHSLATAYLLLGQLDRARQQLNSVLTLCRTGGDLYDEAAALAWLARADHDTGHYQHALDRAQAAVDLTKDSGEPETRSLALNTVATIHRSLGETRAAIEHHEAALAVARNIGYRLGITEAMTGLAAAHHRLGHHQEALQLADDALDGTRQAGFRLLEGQALGVLAEIYNGQGRHDKAMAHAQRALAVHRETGHRLGEATSLVALGHAIHRTEGIDAAVPHWHRARALFAQIGAPEPHDLRAPLAS